MRRRGNLEKSRIKVGKKGRIRGGYLIRLVLGRIRSRIGIRGLDYRVGISRKS